MQRVASLFFFLGWGFLSCLSASSQGSGAGPSKIIIIRHGEKPAEGDNLSCAGFNRALQLANVLDRKAGTANAIFVPSLKMGKSTGVARMYQTILPYAIKHNLLINTKFDVDDVSGLAAGIRKKEGTVVIVWEHKHIRKLLQALGIDSQEKWDEDDYDTIFILVPAKGKLVLTKDREGIKPSNSCP